MLNLQRSGYAQVAGAFSDACLQSANFPQTTYKRLRLLAADAGTLWVPWLEERQASNPLPPFNFTT
jgi:hypothetical protein